MSTKVVIRSRIATTSEPGFQLYWDCLDELAAVSEENIPLFLRLDGVAVELSTLPTGGASVTVKLPRGLALELGLASTPD